jgi:hypothetical protein
MLVGLNNKKPGTKPGFFYVLLDLCAVREVRAGVSQTLIVRD